MAKVATEHSIAHMMMENSVQQPPSTKDLHRNEEEDDENDEESPEQPSSLHHGPPADSPGELHAMPHVAPPPGLRKQSSYKNENPWNRPRTGKMISFVDEQDSNTALHEITYSKFTHYSRAAQTQAAPPPSGGCCVLQ